jgi:hypothetical protein
VKGEERRRGSSRGRKKGVKECGVFANINVKGIGRPPHKGLDVVVGPPAGSKESGTAGAEGVATEGKGEEGVKPGEVPSSIYGMRLYCG